MNLPSSFIEKMKILFKKDYRSFIKSYETHPIGGLRRNTLKISPDKLLNLLQIPLKKISWCENGFYFPSDFRPGKGPLYHAWLYCIQEPYAMAPVSVFNINLGDKILDLCAAPGGKTTQLSSKLNGTGVIVSNDLSPSRCKSLVENIEIADIKNAVVTSEKPKNLVYHFPNYFNKISIDAPSSWRRNVP